MNIENTSPTLTGDTHIEDSGTCPSTNPKVLRRNVAWKWSSVPGMLIITVCIWSVAEAWIEVDAASPGEVCAIVIAKLIWCGVGRLAMLGKRNWRGVFVFLCCASVFVVGSALPSISAVSKTLFLILLTECTLKTLCLVALSGIRFGPPSGS